MVVSASRVAREGMDHAEQLTPRATQIMDLAIQGLRSGQIAERLGLSHPYVCTVMSAPNFQHQLAIRRERLEDRIDEKVANATVEAATILKENAVRAAKKLVELVDGSDNPLALRASESVLDRAGVTKKSERGGLMMQQQVIVLDEKTAQAIEETLMMEKSDASGSNGD